MRFVATECRERVMKDNCEGFDGYRWGMSRVKSGSSEVGRRRKIENRAGCKGGARVASRFFAVILIRYVNYYAFIDFILHISRQGSENATLKYSFTVNQIMVIKKTVISRWFWDHSVYRCISIRARADSVAKSCGGALEIRGKGGKRMGSGNEWMAKKVNLRPGIECINVAVGEHLYGELREKLNENWSCMLYAPPTKVTFP